MTQWGMAPYQVWLRKQKTFAQLSAAPDKRRKRSRPGFEPRGGMGRIETICTMRLKVVVPHRKERGHSNGRYHDWRSWSHPTRRSERRRTLSSEELGDEIRLLPG